MQEHHRLLILGSGPAGCTAAVYAARANLKPALITGIEPGGQITKTHKIENWPGAFQGITGPNLMENMLTHIQNFNTKVIFDHIIDANLSEKPFLLKGETAEYTCDALIIATGASAKYLEIPSEKKFIGKGVSACAVCDGMFYKGAEVVVVGGGNTAIEEATYLAAIAAKVTIIHRRESFRAEPVLVNNLKKLPNINFEYNKIVEEILGDNTGVTGIRIKDTNTHHTKYIPAKGVFLAVGYTPNSSIFINQVEMEDEYIKIINNTANYSTCTSVNGVFVAGDVADPIYRQAINAAASGCRAALDAKRYLCHD